MSALLSFGYIGPQYQGIGEMKTRMTAPLVGEQSLALVLNQPLHPGRCEAEFPGNEQSIRDVDIGVRGVEQ